MIKTFEIYLVTLFLKKILNIFLIFFALTFILNLLEEINFFKDLKILKSVLFSSLENVALNFENNEDAKVQIMGLLESRALDFENVIITSVNEGTLPKGKMHSSLIPYDLRKKHSLLTYSERDAIYTYHFYRLIKRAKNIYLIYNTYLTLLK